MSVVSTHASTSNLLIALHPLVLLTISDYITRHHLRRLQGPVIGILWGTQKGRQVEIEHAFEAAVKQVDDEGDMVKNEEWTMDISWVRARIAAFAETHANSDVLGWFAISNSLTFQPTPNHLRIHEEFLQFNETPLFLLLNPSPAASVGGKLPIAIYESIFEAPSKDQSGDAMETDSPEAPDNLLRFVGPLKYTLETGEAEMIGVNYIAKGGFGNAAAVAPEEAAAIAAAATADSKGKAPAVEEKKEEKEQHHALKDAGGHDELIASLQSKANAIKMLNSRIQLIRKYLLSLPQPPHTLPLEALENPPPVDEHALPISHPLLRQIKSLTTTRLPLISPPSNTESSAQLATEALQEENDVHLVALMGLLVKSLQEVKEVGRKYSVMERAAFQEKAFHNKASFAGMMGSW